MQTVSWISDSPKTASKVRSLGKTDPTQQLNYDDHVNPSQDWSIRKIAELLK